MSWWVYVTIKNLTITYLIMQISRPLQWILNFNIIGSGVKNGVDAFKHSKKDACAR